MVLNRLRQLARGQIPDSDRTVAPAGCEQSRIGTKCQTKNGIVRLDQIANQLAAARIPESHEPRLGRRSARSRDPPAVRAVADCVSTLGQILQALQQFSAGHLPNKYLVVPARGQLSAVWIER